MNIAAGAWSWPLTSI